MVTRLFAGPILSNTEWYAIIIGAFLLACLFLAGSIYLLTKYAPVKRFTKSKFSIKQSLLLSVGTLDLITLAPVVIPTLVSDQRWQNKQAECARSVGYATPADNESSAATAATQSAYRSCLDAD